MRINHKVLSIPPYLSTSWKNISSLQSKQEGDKHSLIILLQNGSTIEVPDLEALVIQAIFDAHAKYVEIENKASKNNSDLIREKPQIKDTSTSIKFFEFENMNAMLSHNESERNSPDLPHYVLSKVESITEDMGLANSDSATLPFPEANCNCPYCQIAKAIQKKHNPKCELTFQDEDEEVTEKDLSFTSWIIRPLENSFYSVIHPDSPEKEYQVYLKTPIGCTCGSRQCEHIRAVLSS